jgi:mono/diheme cytochrome c family protein
MRRALSLLLACVLLSLCTAGVAATGQALYRRHCIQCHAPGVDHPGTLQLSVTRDQAYAVLEQRSDLSADYVRQVVRQGLKTMPAFKPTTLTDQELDALADYLKK